MQQYGIIEAEACLLAEDKALTRYFETCVQIADGVPVRTILNWITGGVFAWINQTGESINSIKVPPEALIGLLRQVQRKAVNVNTAKSILNEMLQNGKTALDIIQQNDLQQVSDTGQIAGMVHEVLQSHPKEVQAYMAGKETLANWLFGQVMRQAGGKADPHLIRTELENQLKNLGS